MEASDWINLVSAIGTIGATGVALWLARRSTSRHVDGTFIWEISTSYQPTLLIQNTSDRIVVLESIEVRYHRKPACLIKMDKSYSFSKYSIIEVGQVVKIPLGDAEFTFKTPNNQKKKYRLKIIIQQRNGRQYVCVSKYSFEELQERFFGKGLFSGINSAVI